MTIGGKTVSVGGMCKGSGMIHPNMATMLGVVTTDAAVDVEVWRGILRRATDASFNAVGGRELKGWGGGAAVVLGVPVGVAGSGACVPNGWKEPHVCCTHGYELPCLTMTAPRLPAAAALQITVDGDTSTNDTVIGLASGAAGTPLITDANSQDGKTLEAAVTALLQVGQ